MRSPPPDPRAVVAEIDQLKERLRLAASHPGAANVPLLEDAGAALRAAMKAMDDMHKVRRSSTRTGLTDVVKAIKKARHALDQAQK
jgi:hypothetical protein